MTKYDYKEKFEQTRQLVNKWDPCSFIDAGAPKDEYDTLPYKILSGVINQREAVNLREEIIDLLGNYYGNFDLNELLTKNQELLKNDIDELIQKTNANNL